MRNQVNRKTLLAAAAAACIFCLAAAAHAQAPASITTDGGTIRAIPDAKFFKAPGYSPYAGRNFPVRPLWGDQHVHTSWSGDAVAAGTRVGPEEALRLARGEQITSSTGQPVKLSRPLDWLVIADHSDAMGVMNEVLAGNPKLMTDPTAKRWNQQMNVGVEEGMKVLIEIMTLVGQGKIPEALKDPVFAFEIWKKLTAINEKYNDPGRFTSFIGYEWTSNRNGNNLHRNVIYRDGKDKADQVAPLTTFDTEDPEDLWKWMQAYEDKTGGRVLAIPHNGNLSNGWMFDLKTFKGEPLSKEWAQTRAKWEPLYEVTQGKGTSEQHPSLAPNDEFARFELWDRYNLNVVPKKPGMVNTEYAREAYKNGLALDARLGANPFKFGLAGGTDAHTGLTAAEEPNFFGKFPASEPSPERWSENAYEVDGRTVKGWELGASGYTAVWATENTRAAIWDAMKRKETYASTGPRMTVRFFGGFDFAPADANTRELGVLGYQKGVPMGGDLKAAPAGKQPTFLVAAAKDPLSGNLDRIQIVKGWVDKTGKTQEKIYDVAWSDPAKRKLGPNGKLPSVGNTVDVKNATWRNSIGATELITVWKDPAFDPTLRAFYYARVIEIPTPRWTAFDQVRFNIKMSPEVPMTLQERAYTSPIWYSPS